MGYSLVILKPLEKKKMFSLFSSSLPSMTVVTFVGNVAAVSETTTKGADFALFSSFVATSLQTTNFLAATPPIDNDERDRAAAHGEEEVDVTTYGTAATCSYSSFVTDDKCLKIETFFDNEFMISNFLLKKLGLDDFQGFLAFFDAQKLKRFL